jgi:serine/threonine protein kinase
MGVSRILNAIPLSVGRYQLAGRVGTGNEELLYRARDGDTEGLVRVQLIPTNPSAASALYQCLSAEIKSAAQLEHPNILRILDCGREGDYVYLVTEWVEGLTLEQMIEAHSRLPEDTAVRIITQIGQAVDYAHSRNRCPMRVNRTSILVRNDGVAKLLAFEPTSDSMTPDVGPLPGDPIKTSVPGSVRKPTNLSFAHAIYSLGATLFEAVTGVGWVDPNTLPAPPPRKNGRPRSQRRRIILGLSERVDLAVRRATDADPAKRPASCAEWLKMLHPKSRVTGSSADMRIATDDANDRRAYVRYAVGVGSSCTINSSLFDVPVPGDQPEPPAVWPLVVRDLSAGGVGILLARRCEPGTELLIELVSGPNRVTQSLPVRVVRVRKDTHGHWVHGCQFLTPLDEDGLATVFSHLGRSDTV